MGWVDGLNPNSVLIGEQKTKDKATRSHLWLIKNAFLFFVFCFVLGFFFPHLSEARAVTFCYRAFPGNYHRREVTASGQIWINISSSLECKAEDKHKMLMQMKSRHLINSRSGEWYGEMGFLETGEKALREYQHRLLISAAVEHQRSTQPLSPEETNIATGAAGINMHLSPGGTAQWAGIRSSAGWTEEEEEEEELGETKMVDEYWEIQQALRLTQPHVGSIMRPNPLHTAQDVCLCSVRPP